MRKRLAKPMQTHPLGADKRNKNDDDNIKIKSSSKGEKIGIGTMTVENHGFAAAPRKTKNTADDDLVRPSRNKRQL
jgi:hypothetical protein